MFRQPEKKLSISGRVKRAAQASGKARLRVSSFVMLAHVLFTIDLSPKWRACSQANVSLSTNRTDKDSPKQRYLITFAGGISVI